MVYLHSLAFVSAIYNKNIFTNFYIKSKTIVIATYLTFVKSNSHVPNVLRF